jgi:single-stranded DNA-binding protein
MLLLGLNNVQIIGNLGGTPEMKYLNTLVLARTDPVALRRSNPH